MNIRFDDDRCDLRARQMLRLEGGADTTVDSCDLASNFDAALDPADVYRLFEPFRNT